MVLGVSPQILCGYLNFQVTVSSQFFHLSESEIQRFPILQVRIREPSVPNFPKCSYKNKSICQNQRTVCS
jgi:hypothetical protein